jgi:hypothetical protein
LAPSPPDTARVGQPLKLLLLIAVSDFVLALRASVNGLTNSPSVLCGTPYSSHQHPFNSLSMKIAMPEEGVEPS